MKVLVIGSGGREHALVWKISQSRLVDAIFCIPGNGGISEVADCIDMDIANIEDIASFARKEGIGLTVVGPENPLAMGIVDAFEKKGMPIFGPCQKGSMLETSKVFTKGLMDRYDVPTAPFKTFSNYVEARSYMETLKPPFVIKADGLCAGKGAYVISDKREGQDVLKDLMVTHVHGDAGNSVVIEEFLPGIEASYIAFTDGDTVFPMLPSQDHKALLDDDKGPNTGGMGAYAPIPFISRDLEKKIDDEIMGRTVNALRKEGIKYKGVLYGGLMLSDNGDPYVLEFNVRMGDPETQPILFKMKSDIVPVLLACVEGRLNTIKNIEWKEGVSICVVLASRGYPDKPERGMIIKGLKDLENREDIMVFHAGTKRAGDELITSGGRVLGVTAMGSDYEDAIKKVYEAVGCIKFDGMQYRKDIGRKAKDYTREKVMRGKVVE